jgi:hypothetical protein
MSTFQAVKELFRQPSRRGFRDWLIVLWIVIGMAYTLSIPSLLSAATGYTAPTNSWWEMPDQVSIQHLPPGFYSFVVINHMLNNVSRD